MSESIKTCPTDGLSTIKAFSTIITNYDKLFLSSVYAIPDVKSTLESSYSYDQTFLDKEKVVYDPKNFEPRTGRVDLEGRPIVTNEYEKICTLIELTENKIRYLATQKELLSDILETSISKLGADVGNQYRIENVISTPNMLTSMAVKNTFVKELSTIYSKSLFFMDILQSSPGYGKTSI